MGLRLMERRVYDRMAELADVHWWYVARRRILAELIRREIRPPARARILEIGCGTGHNLGMLGEFGSVDGLEVDDEARGVAEGHHGKAILSAPLPELTDIRSRTYDLIAALDVVEHVDDDTAALAAIAERLKPGGKLLLTVPAHQWMWSAHDTANHHKRRYSKKRLKALVEASPLHLEKIGYFNSLLFPLAVAARGAGRLTGKDDSDDKLPPKPVNALFERIFEAERYLVGRLPLPPGLSLFAIASAR
jgi:2-polyprenyl-3-methyl-5-hydroxy-6-metoxy-1,4-benzoquinol methylase